MTRDRLIHIVIQDLVKLCMKTYDAEFKAVCNSIDKEFALKASQYRTKRDELKFCKAEFDETKKQLDKLQQWQELAPENVEHEIEMFYYQKFRQEQFQNFFTGLLKEINAGKRGPIVDFDVRISPELLEQATFKNRKTKKEYSLNQLPKVGGDGTVKSFLNAIKKKYSVYTLAKKVECSPHHVLICASSEMYPVTVIFAEGVSLPVSIKDPVRHIIYAMALNYSLGNLRLRIKSLEAQGAEPDEVFGDIPAPKYRLTLTPFGEYVLSENILSGISKELKKEGFIDCKNGQSIGTIFRNGFLKGNKIDWVRKDEAISNMLYFMYLAWDVYPLIKKGRGFKSYSFKPFPYYFQIESK